MSLTFNQQLEPIRFSKIYEKMNNQHEKASKSPFMRKFHSNSKSNTCSMKSMVLEKDISEDIYKTSYQKNHNDNLKNFKVNNLNTFYYRKENLTKAAVTYVPKNYHSVQYKTIGCEKSKNLYNSTQIQFLKPSGQIKAVDEAYFTKNNVKKSIQQTFLAERRHYRFKLPTQPSKLSPYLYYSFK